MDLLRPPARLLRRSLLLDLLTAAGLPGRFLALGLGGHGCSLHVLLIVLPHHGVARLVVVTLGVKRLLLLHRAGIAISRILPLIDR